MKSKIFLLSALTVFFLPALSGFDITEKTCIILPEKPLKSTELAAAELSSYVKKVSGITLAREKTGAANFIYIGLASDFKDLPASAKNKLARTVAEDSYLLHIQGNKMYFAGKSKTAELYAVYQFLEKELGIRFFKPANKMDPGEYLPVQKRNRIALKERSIVCEPAFRRRLLVPTAWNWVDHPVNGVIWSVKGGFQMRAAYFHSSRIRRKNSRQVALYEPRTADIWEENYHNLFQQAIPPKKYFKTHPEYFAYSNGKRINPGYETCAYCLSNPEVRRLAADYIIKNIKDKKKMRLTFMQGGGLSDMSRGWCECKNCLKEDGGKTYNWKNISNVYNRTLKAVFDLVYKEIPDAQLILWAYGSYRNPPAKELKHDPRTHFLFMTHGRCYAHAINEPCHRNKNLRSWLEEYISRHKRTSIYEYFLCSGGQNYVPQEVIQAQDLKYFHKAGVTGWEEETFFEDSVYWRKDVKRPEANEKLPSLWQWLYLTGKMLWDPSLDPQKIIEDAESKYYGKAYPAMKKYHALRRKLWKETRNCFGYPFSNERLPLLLNVPENREKLFSLLKEAEKLAGKDKILLYRIGNDRKFLENYWVKANKDYKRLQGNVLKAPTASMRITLDGKGDESAWKNAFYVTDFRETFQKDHKPIPSSLALSVGILSDAENLYFLVKSREPLMNKLYQGKNIWEKSSFELFLHPQSVSNEYYHFLFTLDGDLYEARCPGNAPYKIGAEFKSTRNKDSYVMEIRIPAHLLGDFRNGVNWKCNMGVNRFVYDGKQIRGHHSLGGNLYHDVTKFLPLQKGTPVKINGIFNKLEKKKRKYPANLKVLEKLPASWYPSLPQKNGAVYGIKMEKSPYDETLFITKVFANHPLPGSLKEGDKLTISFEAKGKGKLACGLIRYQKKPYKFLRTEYPAKDFPLKDSWQKFSFTYQVKKGESMHLAFNAFRCEAQIDNVNIVVSEGK